MFCTTWRQYQFWIQSICIVQKSTSICKKISYPLFSVRFLILNNEAEINLENTARKSITWECFIEKNKICYSTFHNTEYCDHVNNKYKVQLVTKLFGNPFSRYRIKPITRALTAIAANELMLSLQFPGFLKLTLARLARSQISWHSHGSSFVSVWFGHALNYRQLRNVFTGTTIFWHNARA